MDVVRREVAISDIWSCSLFDIIMLAHTYQAEMPGRQSDARKSITPHFFTGNRRGRTVDNACGLLRRWQQSDNNRERGRGNHHLGYPYRQRTASGAEYH